MIASLNAVLDLVCEFFTSLGIRQIHWITREWVKALKESKHPTRNGDGFAILGEDVAP